MKIERILWDEETVDHIADHSVSPVEVEEALFNQEEGSLVLRGREGRHLAYGRTHGGRFLFVVKIPKFKSIKEERQFWDKHDSTRYHEDLEVAQDVVFVRPLPPTTYARMLTIKGVGRAAKK